MHFKRKLEIKSGIDLTPMIDIVFNLLIFFMVSATLTNTPLIKVNLPKSSSAENDKLEGVYITLTSEGKFYLNKEEVSYEILQTKLKELADKDGTDQTVIIRSDETVATKVLIDTMDSAKASGFNKLSIATLEK